MKELAAASRISNLTDCDREPIHIPGSIQPHGVLLAVDPGSLKVVQIAGDTKRLLGLDPKDLLGHGMEALVTQAELESLKALADREVTIPRSVFAFEMRVQHRGDTLDAIVHQSGGALVVELEPCLARPPINPLLLVQGMVTRVQKPRIWPVFYRQLRKKSARQQALIA